MHLIRPGAGHADVKLGLHALGIGAGAERPVIEAVASAAEEHGFATLWAGDTSSWSDAVGVALPLRR